MQQSSLVVFSQPNELLLLHSRRPSRGYTDHQARGWATPRPLPGLAGRRGHGGEAGAGDSLPSGGVTHDHCWHLACILPAIIVRTGHRLVPSRGGRARGRGCRHGSRQVPAVRGEGERGGGEELAPTAGGVASDGRREGEPLSHGNVIKRRLAFRSVPARRRGHSEGGLPRHSLL